MEVQDVTVYVDSRKTDNNNESVQDNKSGSNNQPSVFKTNNEGSISIQNVPFVPSVFETPISITIRNEDKDGRIDDTSPNTPGTISVSTISNSHFTNVSTYKYKCIRLNIDMITRDQFIGLSDSRLVSSNWKHFFYCTTIYF